jgi:ABC-type glycerol-3-phosphate transport system permease component
MMGVSPFSMIPMLLVFFQRYFVQGIAGTGMN